MRFSKSARRGLAGGEGGRPELPCLNLRGQSNAVTAILNLQVAEPQIRYRRP